MGECIIFKSGRSGIDPSECTAEPGDVLSGKMAGLKGFDSATAGTMSSYKNATYSWCGYETIVLQPHPDAPTSQALVTVPQAYSNKNGYYDSSSKITGNIANLIASNIKSGVVVGRSPSYGADSTNSITGTFTNDGTISAGDVLSGKKAYSKGNAITGSMPNQGAKTSALNCGGSYTIPAGYHNGSGKVTANSLSSQTSATASAANILNGQTAWVNGSKLTGTMKNWTGTPNHIVNRRISNGRFEVAVDAGYHGCYWNGNSYEYMEYSEVASTLGLSAGNLAQGTVKCGLTGTYKGLGNATADKVLSGSTFSTASLSNASGTMPNRGAVSQALNCGGSYTIPAGYHNGSGKVTANALSGQTAANATAGQILSGQTAWVNGSKVTGTMANRGAATSSLNCGGSYTIPAGYHNGSGKVTANSLSSQTSATATAAQIWTGKTAWVNGSKLTGTLATQGGSTATPGTANKTIVSANKIVTGNIIVAGDANLVAANIRKGKTIFGVAGSFQGYTDSPLYLYNTGTWSNLQTTGFSNMKGNANESAASGIHPKRIVISNRPSIRLKQAVNLSAYAYVVIECQGFSVSGATGRDIYLSVSSNPNIVSNTGYTASVKATKTDYSLLSLNVSSLSGDYYIYIHNIEAGGTANISKIYLTTS